MAEREHVDMEALRIRSQRAIEVLNEAGWVFDEYIKAETAWLLATEPFDKDAREFSYSLIRATAEVKARLILTAQAHATEEKLASRRTTV